MANDSDSQNKLKLASDSADRLFQAQEKLTKIFENELAKEIPEAIKENDDEILKRKIEDLQRAIQSMEQTLDDSVLALDWIDDVNKDEAFAEAHHDEIEDVTKIVANVRTKLTHQIEAAKKLQTLAKKGLDSAAGSKEVAERELDEIEGRVNSEKKYLPGAVQKAEDANDKAQKALDARDSKALGEAQKAMENVGVDAIQMYHDTQDFETRIPTFLKKIQSESLDEDTLSELKDGIKRLLLTNQENAKAVKHLTELNKSVKESKIGEIDVKKTLKTLQIDPKIQSKVEPVLAKVLKGPGKDLEKGLDALAKQFKLSTTGKQMAAALKKAGDSIYK
jgi:hypothetical protein